jgi:hypothetical protein
MRGGKREGAGRKGYGPSKAYWLPVALEPEIVAMMEKYKKEYHKPNENIGNQKEPEETQNDSLRKSKVPVKPIFPILNKEQVKRLQDWLLKYKFVKKTTEARKLTATPRLCQETFLKYAPFANENESKEIGDIIELYCVD